MGCVWKFAIVIMAKLRPWFWSRYHVSCY